MAQFVIDWESRPGGAAQKGDWNSGTTYSNGNFVFFILSGEQYNRVFEATSSPTVGQSPQSHPAKWIDKTATDANEFSQPTIDQLYPSWGGMSIPHTPRVRKVELGDGYTQIQPQGINRYTDEFTLNFNNISGTNAKSIQLWAEVTEAITKFEFYFPDPINATWDLRLESWVQTWNQWNSFTTSLKVKRAYGFF